MKMEYAVYDMIMAYVLNALGILEKTEYLLSISLPRDISKMIFSYH